MVFLLHKENLGRPLQRVRMRPKRDHGKVEETLSLTRRTFCFFFLAKPEASGPQVLGISAHADRSKYHGMLKINKRASNCKKTPKLTEFKQNQITTYLRFRYSYWNRFRDYNLAKFNRFHFTIIFFSKRERLRLISQSVSEHPNE